MVKSGRSPSVGRCIYCGSESPPLTDEHVIPEGLGDNYILSKASCKVCEKVTCRFEGEVLQGMLHPARKMVGISGKKRKRKNTIRIPLVSGNSEVVWDDIEPERVGLKAAMLDFKHPPSILTGQYRNSYSNLGLFSIVDPDNLPTLEEVGNVLHVRPFSFVRMLAKIAHAEAVSICGIDAFESFLPAIILGQEDRWPDYVGRSLDQSPLCNRPYCSFVTIYKLAHKRKAHEALVAARVHLLAQLGSPIYQVVIGRVKSRSLVDVHHSSVKTHIEGFGTVSQQNAPDLTIDRSEVKRNDLCFCASGLRFKHCHGRR